MEEAEIKVASGPQQGSFSYFHFNPEVHAREKPYEILINLPLAGSTSHTYRRHNQEFQDRQVVVHDGRGRERDFTLNRNGFCWKVWHGPREWQGINAAGVKAMGNEWVRAGYIRDVESFIRAELETDDGGRGQIDTVMVFDYRLRVSMDPKQFKKQILDLDDGLDAMIPSIHPHIDQSARGAMLRVRKHMGSKSDELLQRRYRIVNVWKPLKKVGSWPLAMCDSTSVHQSDLVATDLVRRKHIGESYYGVYSPAHTWHYLSNQQPHEVTMLKIYDSDKTKASFCLHAAFQNPGFLGLSDSRESFEVRALVFDKADLP